MKLTKDTPSHYYSKDISYRSNLEFIEGPTFRQKAIFDCITALMGNTEWYGYNGDEATINEAIRIVDRTFEILNKEK